MTDPAEDYSRELEELVGTLPVDDEPPGPFDTLESLLTVREDIRLWAFRKLFEVDPANSLREIFPSNTPRERIEFGLEYKRQERNRKVRQRLDEAEAKTNRVDPPPIVSLTEFLSEPDEDVRYRVDGLWPRNGRILLTAQFKAGKTTLTGNLIRSLVDGDDFLDTFTVEPADRVVLLDNELAPNMIRLWLRDQDIRKTDAVDLVSLRGRLSAFNILDPGVRTEWAELIGQADVLVLDCLRPVLDALGLSEDKEAGRFLTALDELAREAGVSELLLVHHMGHSNERSRGDSRLLDWPDAIWKLVRDGVEQDAPDPDSPPARYFSAVGRDVEQPERRLAFDPDTRHLSINGPSRSLARVSDLENAVQEWVGKNPGCSQNNIEQNVEGKTGYIRSAVKSLVNDGWIRIEKKGNGHLHFPGDGGAAAAFSE